jgi:hypothetical protein
MKKLLWNLVLFFLATTSFAEEIFHLHSPCHMPKDCIPTFQYNLIWQGEYLTCAPESSSGHSWTWQIDIHDQCKNFLKYPIQDSPRIGVNWRSHQKSDAQKVMVALLKARYPVIPCEGHLSGQCISEDERCLPVKQAKFKFGVFLDSSCHNIDLESSPQRTFFPDFFVTYLLGNQQPYPYLEPIYFEKKTQAEAIPVTVKASLAEKKVIVEQRWSSDVEMPTHKPRYFCIGLLVASPMKPQTLFEWLFAEQEELSSRLVADHNCSEAAISSGNLRCTIEYFDQKTNTVYDTYQSHCRRVSEEGIIL